MSTKQAKSAEAPQEAAAEMKTQNIVTKAKQGGNIVYLGPTIAGVIKHSTVFQGGVLPEKTQKCMSDFPAMSRLLVRTDKMAEAVKELHKQQSALRTIYVQTAQKFSTGGK